MTMFCNYGHPLVPGIGTLDNFYAKQHADGEICREIVRATGQDFGPWVNSEHKGLFSRWGDTAVRQGLLRQVRRAARSPQPPPCLTLDSLNHPLFAWAELESVRVTGDRSRLQLVYEPLVRYYRALQKYLRQGNGLYVTDWASMDNSPRNLLRRRRHGRGYLGRNGPLRQPARRDRRPAGQEGRGRGLSQAKPPNWRG